MNAMQKMTEGMIKENQPKFEVGDTVRVVRPYQGRRQGAYPGFRRYRYC